MASRYEMCDSVTFVSDSGHVKVVRHGTWLRRRQVLVSVLQGSRLVVFWVPERVLAKEAARRLSTQGDVEGLDSGEFQPIWLRAEAIRLKYDDQYPDMSYTMSLLDRAAGEIEALRREKAEDVEGLAKQVVDFAKGHCDFVASGEPSCMEHERGVNECDLCRAADLFRMSHEEALAFKRLTQERKK